MHKIKSYILSIMKDERRTPDTYIVRVVLSVVSLLYLAVLCSVYALCKAKILRAHEVGGKVISIGNITLGGTGKTPFAIKLAGEIKKMGRRPVVLNRGYGNDEAYLLREKLKDTPVLIGRDRVKNARKAFDELGSDCVILDDGFQHYRIKRDLDIVLIDATYPLGNLKLFPKGVLREPLTRLKDADIAILTKSDMGCDNIDYISSELKRVNKEIDIVKSSYEPVDFIKISSQDVLPLSYIKGKKIALLAGIANPDYFGWMLSKLGAQIDERFFYHDHHPYSDRDMSYIVERCLARGIDTIITTEKDVVRLKRLKSLPSSLEMLALRIDFRIGSDWEALVDRLHTVFNS